MIPTYNRLRYLEETVRSVLEQDPGPDRMQVEVVDNCSTEGDPEEIVRKVAGNRISVYRQPRNVGLHANWNTCISRAHGRWIHILHDDDVVLPGFYNVYERLINRYPDATLLIGPSINVDENSRPMSVSEPMAADEGPVHDFGALQAVRNWIKTPSAVISRAAYEEIGGFCDLLHHTADWEMFFRAGHAGQAVTTTEPYSHYRIHSASDTSRLVLTGENIREGMLAVDLCYARLPPALQRELAPMKYLWLADLARKTSIKLAAKKEWKGSFLQATWALRLAPREHLGTWVKSVLRYPLHQLRSSWSTS
jgi:glycosyltransferase involved in cell wall biosynthesis